jgi:hypothetical protein
MWSHQKLKVRMLVSLRWPCEKNTFREEPPAYGGQPNAEPQGVVSCSRALGSVSGGPEFHALVQRTAQFAVKFAVKFNHLQKQ